MFVRAVAIVLRGHAGHERRHQVHEPHLFGDSAAGVPAKSLAVVHPDHQDSARRNRFPGPAAKHLQRDRTRHVRVPRNIARHTASGSLVCARARGTQVGNGDACSLAKQIRRAFSPRTSRSGILVRLQRYARARGIRRTGRTGDSRLQMSMRSPLAAQKKRVQGDNLRMAPARLQPYVGRHCGGQKTQQEARSPATRPAACLSGANPCRGCPDIGELAGQRPQDQPQRAGLQHAPTQIPGGHGSGRQHHHHGMASAANNAPGERELPAYRPLRTR